MEKMEQLRKDNRGEHYTNEKSRKSKLEEMRHNNSQEDIEKDLNELKRETDKLMVGLELSEMALRLSQTRAMAHSNLSKQGKYQTMSEMFLCFCVLRVS